MTRTLSDRGEAILATMPSFYAEDAAVLSVIGSCAKELDRIEAMLMAVQLGALPQFADDTYGLLSLWEFLVGLPIHPSTATVLQRQSLVRSSRRLRVAAGSDWALALTQAMGTAGWTHTETPGIRVTIAVPLGLGTISSDTIVRLARRLTPAHLDVAATYTTGFLIGISNLGDAL